MARTSRTRDIIVVGGSAGALDALRSILAGLPPDLPAAVLVVLHVGEVSYLPSILVRSSTLPVVPASSGATIEPGQVYVGPPGFHLLVHDSHILLRRGPRENLARPAVDALFRSAAASLGSRVIGIVLSGSLSDGTAGLRAIKRCGGLSIVQSPREAPVPSMPRNALWHTDVDHVCAATEMAGLLSRLVGEPAGPSPEVPTEIRLEAAIAAQELADMRADDMLGKVSRFTCPECHGSLWSIEDGSMLRFRCHVGHAFRPTPFFPRRARKSTECWARFSARTRSAQPSPTGWRSGSALPTGTRWPIISKAARAATRKTRDWSWN